MPEKKGFIHFGGGCTRARVDPQRRVGLANAVASGLDLSLVGVIGEGELTAIRRLADEEVMKEKMEIERAAREATRRAASSAKRAGWPDTLEARRANFLKEQERKADEAAERKRVLDELYILQMEAQRQESIARLVMKNRSEDPRGRNVKSMKMLHEAMKGREEQIAFKKLANDEERDASRKEALELQQKLWGDAAEATHLKLVTRQRNMEEKLANMEKVAEQITQRRQQRKDEKNERQNIEKEAAEEREENEMEEAVKLAKMDEVNTFNAKHAKPYLTPTLRYRQLIADREQNGGGGVELISDKRKNETLARERAKREAFEKRKEIGLTKYAEINAKPNPTHRTQDVFEEKFPSFLNQMESNEDTRLREKKEVRQKLQKESEEVKELNKNLGSLKKMRQHRLMTSEHPKAEITPYDFFSKEEEKAYSAERLRQAEKFRMEEAEEKAALQASVEALKAAQKQQADERSRKAREEKEMERLNVKREIEEMAADDAKYIEYIRSQIPSNMHPALVGKATRMK
ncbi:unnamed protein product [Phytomonas sp. Hart1]|nr:unnamed protein product [Phytomonas sp. Hart1]|eukprot:CCW66783.1 unnamed protein product [Phytomonas sp. isolate Hart1]